MSIQDKAPGGGKKSEELPPPAGGTVISGPKVVADGHGHHDHVHPMGFPPGIAAPVVPAPCPPAPPIPDATPCNDHGFVSFGDILWLRASRRDPIAYQQFSSGNATFANLTGSDTDHELGYRAGGGWLTEGGWLFLATYTQYKDLISELVFPHNGALDYVVGYTGPGQLLSQTLDTTGTLFTSWNLQYRTLDVFAGVVFTPSCYLDLTVGGGARFAWIDQDYRTRIDTTPTDGTLRSEALQLNTKGAGPRFGTEARVYVHPWWSLYGRGFTSLLLAHREDESFLVETLPDGTVDSISAIFYEREEILPVLELAVGTEFSFMNGCCLIGCGYEMTYYFQLATSTVDALAQPRLTNHNDLSIDGFYARVTVLW
jgi:hypothetical protein